MKQQNDESINRIKGVTALLATLVMVGCSDASSDPAATTEGTAETSTGHTMTTADNHTPELDMDSPIALDTSAGTEIGAVYAAYLSPEQEGDEEENTPDLAPDVFKSNAPSIPREERLSRGHGVLSFTRDLSAAYLHLAVENVDPDDIVMFHIHCGRPGQLGPILVDFGLKGDLTEYFEDGVFSTEILNEDITATVEHGDGLVGALTAGCPITPAIPMDKVKTVGGMQFIAEQGELYFNLHTKGHVFFGDIRGQLHRVENREGQ